jgi:carbon storage regulator
MRAPRSAHRLLIPPTNADGLSLNSLHQGGSFMLVLTRKAGQRIHIGSSIVLTIVRLTGNQVRVGIEAPQDVPIYRSEIAALGWRDGQDGATAGSPSASTATTAD